MSRRFLCFLIIINYFILFFQITEAKPRIRHHKGDTRCSCGPGWGVKKFCTVDKNTECEKCKTGTYSPHNNLQSCWVCSRCGPGLYEAHPCTEKTDTICDSCHRHAPDNFDYIKKCKTHLSLFLAPEDAISTGEESALVNENDTRLDEDNREIILAKDIEADFFDQDNFKEKYKQKI